MTTSCGKTSRHARSKATTRQPKPRIDSRLALIDATLDLIFDKGIDAVRLDDIISEVGVTTGSLYWHFRDRDDLIRQALAEHLRRSIEATVEGINTALDTATGRDDYLAQLTPFLANPFDPEHVNARWRRFELLVSTHRDPELRELMHDLQVRSQRAFVDVLTKAQQRGMFRDDLDPVAVATAINALGLGSNIVEILGDDGPTPAAWFGLMGFFVASMFPDQPKRP
ncbi:MAG: TetR/AcrR family transcriptional regulator [Actinobacteria bacterium]|nr:TetR/AcrR family transcriptional regulator [Actinomycetota bacterium]